MQGDALHAMELALALEKLNFSMLFELCKTAEKHEDSNMSDFLESMLAEQVCYSHMWCYQAQECPLEEAYVI